MPIVLDGLVVLIAFSTIYVTYKKGFVRSVLEFAASVISIVLSNHFTPYVSNVYLPILTEQLEQAEKNIPEYAVALFTQALAFVTVFTVLTLIFKVLIVFISGIFKLPVLNSLNKTLGLLLGIAKALMFILLFVAIMQLIVPFINDSQTQTGFFSENVIQQTFVFKRLYNIEWINFLVN